MPRSGRSTRVAVVRALLVALAALVAVLVLRALTVDEAAETRAPPGRSHLDVLWFSADRMRR